MSYLKNSNFSLRRFCLFISIKHTGCNRVTKCHCSGNFAIRDMILMSLKCLYNEQYDGKGKSEFSVFWDITSFDLMSDMLRPTSMFLDCIWKQTHQCVQYGISWKIVNKKWQKKHQIKHFFKKTINFLGSHGVVLVKTFPLIYQLLM